MSDEVSTPAHVQRRQRRTLWVAAVFAGLAISFGVSAQLTMRDAPASISATPEDPCLLNHTCGVEGTVPLDQLTPEELRVECDGLKERGIDVPECAQF